MPSSRTAIARSISRTFARELEVALGQAQAALLHDLDVALLRAEHVEVVAEAPARVQLAARLGDLAQAVAAAQVLGAHRRALDEVEHERAELGQVGDDAGADARRRPPRREFWYSLSRSIASSPASLDETRTT